MLKLARKHGVWDRDFFLKLPLTQNQVEFRSISNVPQPVEFQERLISKQQFQTKSAQQLTVLWD